MTPSPMATCPSSLQVRANLLEALEGFDLPEVARGLGAPGAGWV